MAKVFPSPISHSAHVRAAFKEIIVDVIVLDDLPDVGVYGEGFHFLKGEQEDAVGNFFAYAAKPHKALPGRNNFV